MVFNRMCFKLLTGQMVFNNFFLQIVNSTYGVQQNVFKLLTVHMVFNRIFFKLLTVQMVFNNFFLQIVNSAYGVQQNVFQIVNSAYGV